MPKWPLWTPDGNALVFAAAAGGGNGQLHIIDMMGTQRALLHAPARLPFERAVRYLNLGAPDL